MCSLNVGFIVVVRCVATITACAVCIVISKTATLFAACMISTVASTRVCLFMCAVVVEALLAVTSPTP